MGGKTTSTSAPKLNQMSIQSSSLGLPISLGWGRGRLKCNLIWYDAFTATAHTTKTSAGKGLGGGTKNTTYTYTASIIMGMCEGGATGIQGVRTVYRDTSVFTNGATSALAQAGLSLANGTPTQPVWGYLTSMFPSAAFGYSGIACVRAQDYDLGDSGTLSNHSFEIDFAIQLGGGVPDADPRDIITDFLTNPGYGVPGWTTGLIGDLSDYSLYCRASNLLLSPVLESQTTASDTLTEWCLATNSAPFWSEGLLKIRPYGDASVTGNGVTWTPNLTPAYDLTEDDFSEADEGPVMLDIVDQTDAYNIVQFEFLDRANQYNIAIATADDADNIAEFLERKQDPTTVHCIADASIAAHSAQLYLQRTLYIRRRFRFKLPWNFVLLEPTDLVTLTTENDSLLLNRELVRIVEIEEDEDGLLSFTAEEVPNGTGAAATFAGHSSGGYSPNADVPPGSVSTPVLINAPTALTSGDPEIWCAVASTSANWGGCEIWVSVDGTDYARVGTINGPARYGVLSGALASHADPDTTNTVHVDLTTSRGALGSATTAAANAGGSLCLVGDELITYEGATLTGSYTYDLTTLHRGFQGTVPSLHPTGTSFVRLDDAVFKFSYASLNVGSTIYIKLPSFNVFGRALEDISTVTAYTVDLSPIAGAAPNPANWSLSAVPLGNGGANTPALLVTGVVPGSYVSDWIVEVRTVAVVLSEDGTPLLTEAGMPITTEGSEGPWMADTVQPASATTRTITNGIANLGVYEVAISYRVNGQVGARLVLGPVVAGSLAVSRASYTIKVWSVDYPVTSDDTHIYVAAFSGVLDDSRSIPFPAGTIGSLANNTTYGVFYNLVTAGYEVEVSPAIAHLASSDFVFLGWSITSAGGVYPSPPRPPDGWAGNGVREERQSTL